MIFAIDIRHLASPNPSGVGRYTIELIRELARTAPEDAFFLFASGTKRTLANLPVFDAPNIHIVARRIPNRIMTLLLRLPVGPSLDAFLGKRVDAWLFPNVNYIRTCRPYAVTMHDVSFTLYPEFFTRKTLLWHRFARIKKILANAHAVLAVSQRTAEDVADVYKIDSSKITATPLGVSDVFKPNIQPEDRSFLHTYRIHAPYFLVMSTLEPRKNITSVIEAYGEWRARKKPETAPKLVIAGGAGWKSRSIARAIAASPFREDILHIGYVRERHKPALMRHARALFFPSFYEGFGLPVLEAMASGTPVVTSFTGALPELTEGAAICVDPYNVTDVVQAFEALEDDALCTLLAERGLERAKRYSWRKTAKKTRTTLHAICDKMRA